MLRLIHNFIFKTAATAIIFSLAVSTAYGVQITIYPDSNAPDTADAISVTNTSAPGFGTGAFQANGSAKTANYLPASVLFGGETVTIGELGSFSYWTKQDVPASGTPVNWYVEIYTVANGTDDDSWYGRRLNFEPYFAENRNEPDNTWLKWSTDGVGTTNTNRLRAFDANRGGSGLVFGTYTDPFLSDLTSGTINWSDYSNVYENQTFDYRDEEIWFIGVSTGSGWAGQFDGLVDGFSIKWNGATGVQTSEVNFEPRAVAVPEPGTLSTTRPWRSVDI